MLVAGGGSVVLSRLGSRVAEGRLGQVVARVAEAVLGGKGAVVEKAAGSDARSERGMFVASEAGGNGRGDTDQTD